MKFERASYSTTFSIAPYGINDKVGFDILLEPGDTPEMALEAAKATAEAWYRGHHPAFAARTVQISGEPAKVINRADERLQVLIENAKTVEQLLTFKDKVPAHLKELYDHRLNQLSI